MEGDKERIKQWVEALESGKYEQGKTRLRGGVESSNPDTYCCLGVACDISGLGRWEEQDGDFYYVIDGISNASYLPYAVRTYLGLELNDVLNNDFELQLVSMNDRGESFEYIASKIREKFGLEKE